MSTLVHCIYSSVQSRELTPAEIALLVKESRESNQKHDITGILLHVADTFFQVLEGPREAIEALYGRILKDPRHHRITCIIMEPIPRRYFGDTRMTLAQLSPAQLDGLLSESSLEEREQLLADLDEGRAKRLLRAFSDGRWRSQLGLHPEPMAVRT